MNKKVMWLKFSGRQIKNTAVHKLQHEYKFDSLVMTKKFPPIFIPHSMMSSLKTPLSFFQV